MNSKATTALKSLSKRVLNPLLERAQLFERRLAKLEQTPCWIIVTYHRVIEDERLDPFSLGMCTNQHDFEQQLQLLQSYFEIETTQQVVEDVRAQRAFERPIVSINFDDGYLDNHDIALPILRKLGIPATLFIATGGIGNKELFWWDRITQAVYASRVNSLDLGAYELPGISTHLDLSAKAKRASVVNLLEALWSVERARCRATVDAIVEQLVGETDPKWAPRMQAEQIRRFKAANMEIGAHSVSHYNLLLMDDESLKAELTDCKHSLEAILDQSISGFAYPSGKQSEAMRQATVQAGYDYAVGTHRNFNVFSGLDLFNIERMIVGDSDLADFKRCFSDLAGKLL